MTILSLTVLGFTLSMDWYTSKGLTKKFGVDTSSFTWGFTMWVYGFEFSVWTPFPRRGEELKDEDYS